MFARPTIIFALYLIRFPPLPVPGYDLGPFITPPVHESAAPAALAANAEVVAAQRKQDEEQRAAETGEARDPICLC